MPDVNIFQDLTFLTSPVHPHARGENYLSSPEICLHLAWGEGKPQSSWERLHRYNEDSFGGHTPLVDCLGRHIV